MAKIKLQELYKRALEAQGYSEVLNSRSHRFIEMRHPDRKRAFFLGSAGSVRIGLRASFTAAVTDEAKAALLGSLAAQMQSVISGYDGNDPRTEGSDAP